MQCENLGQIKRIMFLLMYSLRVFQSCFLLKQILICVAPCDVFVMYFPHNYACMTNNITCHSAHIPFVKIFINTDWNTIQNHLRLRVLRRWLDSPLFIKRLFSCVQCQYPEKNAVLFWDCQAMKSGARMCLTSTSITTI